jgi:glycosyltransferase involved in cell wall biosynthesis
MNTFDVFCHFNKLGETFGNTVAEAMMHKLPVVSLAGSLVYPQAQREMLDSGPQFHRLGASAVAHLRKLCESDAVRAKLGEANQKLALEQYSPEIVGRQVGDLYARVLSNL